MNAIRAAHRASLRPRRSQLVLVALLVALPLLAACGDDNDHSFTDPTATATRAAATGTATRAPATPTSTAMIAATATATLPPLSTPTATATATGTTAATITPTPTATSVARFTGSVEEFYEVPSPLPAGEPGALIRVQDISANAQSTTVRIMYHSRDTLDRDRAVTGTLTYPNGVAPEGGWPVVSLAHGTTGLASPCAPSRGGRAAPTFGVAAVGVATDYIGLGPVGELHPYLSRVSEAHSVIDAVRAARNMSEAEAGTRWLAIGHSQGGHAAIATNEVGAAYAPELELLGTIALAPGALFDRTYGALDEIVVRIVSVMALYGAPSEHPEVIPADYVGPEAAAAAPVIEEKCLNDIIAAFVGLDANTFWSHNPMETEPARSVALSNDVGGVSVDAPLFLISGTADQTVVIDRARDLFAKLCDAGQVTEYLELEGATHDNEYAQGAAQISAWLQDRLDGKPAVDSCE